MLRAQNRAKAIYQAQPVWADVKALSAVYDAARKMRADGDDVHVDHIYPLKGPNFCGLHVSYNLRVIPASENIRDSNNTYPDHPQMDLFAESHASNFFELTSPNG